MATVALGFASSHRTLRSAPLAVWSRWEEHDKVDPRLDYAALLAQAGSSLEAEIAPVVGANRLVSRN